MTPGSTKLAVCLPRCECACDLCAPFAAIADHQHSISFQMSAEEKQHVLSTTSLADRMPYFDISCCPITHEVEQRMEQISRSPHGRITTSIGSPARTIARGVGMPCTRAAPNSLVRACGHLSDRAFRVVCTPAQYPSAATMNTHARCVRFTAGRAGSSWAINSTTAERAAISTPTRALAALRTLTLSLSMIFEPSP